MKELIKEKDVRKIFKDCGFDKVMNKMLKGKKKIELTKKEFTDYSIHISKTMANTLGNKIFEMEPGKEENKMKEQTDEELDKEVGADWMPTSTLNHMNYLRAIYREIKKQGGKQK